MRVPVRVNASREHALEDGRRLRIRALFDLRGHEVGAEEILNAGRARPLGERERPFR